MPEGTRELLTPGGWTGRVLNGGLDPASCDPDLLRRVRVTTASHLMGIIVCPLNGLVYSSMASEKFIWVYASAAALWLASIVLLRLTHRPLISARIGLLTLFGVVGASAWLLGGDPSPMISWLMVVPVAAAVVGVSLDLAGALIGAAVLTAGFWALPQLGIHPENTLRPAYAEIAPLFYREFGLGVVAMLLWIWLSSQRVLERQLTRSVEQANEKAQNVALLLDVSAISNAGGTFNSIASKCVVRVCEALGGCSGRVWEIEGAVRRVLSSHQGDEPAPRLLEEDAARELFGLGLQARVVDLSPRAKRPLQLLIQPIRIDRAVIGVIELLLPSGARAPAEALELVGHVAAQLGRAAESERSHREIRALAYVDTVSGLPNRHAFQERLPGVLEATRAKRAQAALLFVDLNGFKRVNDSLGHDAGDLLLREVADRLRSAIRMSDHLWRAPLDVAQVARFGGDEFTLLLVDVAGPRGAEIVAQRILEDLTVPVQIAGQEVVVGASIGIAMFPADASTATELIQRADRAMYRAKQRGTSAWERHDGSGELSRRSFELGEDLRRALDDGAITLHYQPVFRARDGALIGAEALARWNHPIRGAVSPGEFIPIAESNGLIERLGRFVLDETCRQTAAWAARLPQDFRTAANLSARQLLSPVQNQLRESLARHQCEARRIELELTETALLVANAGVEQRLHEIVNLGVQLVLDDFGTGYSSLAFLKQFPIRKVKIDRGFVHGLPLETGDVAITLAIIAMAHTLGLGVVAEGVEDEAQQEFLTARGCDELQGFLLGKPVPAAEFEQRWLR